MGGLAKDYLALYLDGKIKVDPVTNCWTFHTAPPPHRKLYTFFYGKEVPKYINGDRSCVCHTCDNLLCINPNHYFIGTYHTNQQDCSMKGRRFNGINPQIVNKIRSDPRSCRIVGKEHGISRTMVSYIRRRIYWKDV